MRRNPKFTIGNNPECCNSFIVADELINIVLIGLLANVNK